jgi:hypothetical protein
VFEDRVEQLARVLWISTAQYSMDPFRSAKRTVICLRSPSRAALDGILVPAPETPHAVPPDKGGQITENLFGDVLILPLLSTLRMMPRARFSPAGSCSLSLYIGGARRDRSNLNRTPLNPAGP